MADRTITLSRIYAETGRPVSALAFRCPRWADYIEFGEIQEWQPVGGETGGDGRRLMLVRYPDVVAKYAERCLKAPATAADLAVLDLSDAMAVTKAIEDFFLEARASGATPTGSSGGSGKASETSGG